MSVALVAAVILTLIVKPQQAQPQTRAASLATPLQGK
jgi:hypothetical protein